jgi:hypothetical protein
MGGDGRHESLERKRRQWLGFNERAHEAICFPAHDDPGSGRLEPGGKVGHLPGHHELPRWLGYGHGLTGRDAHAQVEAGAILLLEHGVQLAKTLPHRNGCPCRPLGIVFMHLRHTKNRHDRVACVLLHDTTKGANLLSHFLEEGRKERAELFRVPPHHLGGTSKVSEQHRDELALLCWRHPASTRRRSDS